jgi:hypothetical protein
MSAVLKLFGIGCLMFLQIYFEGKGFLCFFKCHSFKNISNFKGTLLEKALFLRLHKTFSLNLLNQKCQLEDLRMDVIPSFSFRTVDCTKAKNSKKKLSRVDNKLPNCIQTIYFEMSSKIFFFSKKNTSYMVTYLIPVI